MSALAEFLYHLITLILTGSNERYAALRIVIWGFFTGYLNNLAFSLIVLGAGVYLWVFSLVHVSLRDISGRYFGLLVLLGVSIAATVLAVRMG